MLRSCPVVGDPMGPSCKQRFRDIEASMIASTLVLDSYNYGIGYLKGNATILILIHTCAVPVSNTLVRL